MRFFPIVGFVSLLASLAIFLVVTPALRDGVPVAVELPALALKNFDAKGPVWDQQTLRGQVTLINFFASWCVPCAAEMPELAVLKKAFPKLNLIGVAWNDDPAALTPWLKKYHQPFGSVWADPGGEATIALGIRGIPETIIVDSAGRVRYRLMGPVNAALRDGTIDPLLRDLLAEAAHAP